MRTIRTAHRCVALVTSLLLTAAATVSVQAGTFYTGIATVEADAAPNVPVVVGHPDVQVIMFKGNNSRAFTNTYGVDAQGRQLIRTVAVTSLQLYDQQGGGNVSPIRYEGNDVVTAVSVLEGYVESKDADTATTFFTFGRVGLFTVKTEGAFVPTDPSTWGAVVSNASGDPDSLNTAIATYVLKPPEDVRDGLVPGFPLLTDIDGNPYTANTVNRSSVALSPSGKADGNLLFKEETGTNFISVTDPTFPPSQVDAEGFFVQFRQGINSAETGKVNDDDLAFLNFIATNFGGLTDLGAAGTGFATALIDFNDPGLFNDPTYSGTSKFAVNGNGYYGDFVASYDALPSNHGELRGVRPGVETIGVVPEPSTGILASIGLVVTGFVGWRKRKAGTKDVAQSA